MTLDDTAARRGTWQPIGADASADPLAAPGEAPVPPRAVRRARNAAAKAARPPKEPRPKKVLAPRDGRWWAGAMMLSLSMLLLAFIAHAMLGSAFQHSRAQGMAYDELRTTLAKAETPVGQLNVDEEMVAPGTPVALIEAPSIGLREVIVEGTSAEVLRDGAGHRRDTVMPGQSGTSILIGRQATYGGPFGQINRLSLGDEITVTTGQGQNVFRVFGLRRAGDPVPEPLAFGAGRLQLQTADGPALFPDGVLYVDAELVSEVQDTPSRVLGYPALPEAERAMGEDGGRWFTAFFMAVFFVAACAAMLWLWRSWGRWHAWLVGLPVLVWLGVATADAAMNALPNIL